MGAAGWAARLAAEAVPAPVGGCGQWPGSPPVGEMHLMVAHAFECCAAVRALSGVSIPESVDTPGNSRISTIG